MVTLENDSEDAKDFINRAVEMPPDAFCSAFVQLIQTDDNYRLQRWAYDFKPDPRHNVHLRARNSFMSGFLLHCASLLYANIEDWEWKLDTMGDDPHPYSVVLTMKQPFTGWCNIFQAPRLRSYPHTGFVERNGGWTVFF